MFKKNETILILDEESHTRWVLQAFLQDEHISTLAVDTIEKAEQHLSRASSLITEYWIDHQCALDIVRKLKKRVPGAYVMVLTNEPVKDQSYEEMIKAGVDDYFLKPISCAKVLLHLQKGLRQRHLIHQKHQLEVELNRIRKRRDGQGGLKSSMMHKGHAI